MNIEKLFQVLVVAGASSTVGLVACGSSGTGGGSGSSSGGTSGSGSSSGGTSGSGSSSGSSGRPTDAGSSSGSTDAGSACAAVCHQEAVITTWIDCNGCCCWLPVGSMCGPGSTPICGNEPCCKVGSNGR